MPGQGWEITAAGIARPEEEVLHPVPVHHRAEVTVLPEMVITEGILTREGDTTGEAILTIGDGTLITEDIIPIIGAGHITEAGIRTGGGTLTMEAGIPTIGDLAPGMDNGISRLGMFLLPQLSMLSLPLLCILILHNNRLTLIPTLH
jgi:hypothetical protein